MTYSIWQTIAQIPWWVYLIMIGTFRVSYLSTKPYQLNLRNLIQVSSISISFTCIFLGLFIKMTPNIVCILLASFLVGVFFGWLHYRSIKISLSHNIIQMPGSWGVFIFFTLMFLAKFYYFGFQFSIDPTWLTQARYAPWIAGLTSLTIGLTIGRLSYLIKITRQRLAFSPN